MLSYNDRYITYKDKVIYAFGYSNYFIYCIKWGQSLGNIDDANYYSPPTKCEGTWKNIEEYKACKVK